MQDFGTPQQPRLGELAMSPEKEKKERGEKNAINSGHLCFCLQPKLKKLRDINERAVSTTEASCQTGPHTGVPKVSCPLH